MIIKLPAVYDTSHWERIPDFALLNPRPALVITKATEGISFVDQTFVSYFADLKQDGIARGCYHFFRKAFNPTTQAQHFVNTIRDHVTKNDVLALDFEEGGETAAQLIEFLNYVEARFFENQILIYSRKNLMDPILMTSAQKERLRYFPTWVAGYPDDPDQYASVPDFYIPDQTKWGPVWLWQYTDRGLPEGASGDGTDCNWIDPVFLALIQPVVPPPAGSIRRFDSNCWVRFVDSLKRVQVTNLEGRLETVLSAALRLQAQLVVNGDAWVNLNGDNFPISLAKSDGDFYQPAQYDLRPYVGITSDSRFVIAHDQNKADEFFNIVSGVRYLVRDGVKQPYLLGTTPQYVERHPRTGFFVTADGRLGIVVVDGRSTTSAGVTLSQLADIMLEHGAVTGIDGDGGGSTALAENGVLTNQPSETRAVVNHLVVFSEDGEDHMQYKVVWQNGVTKRIRPTTSAPSTGVVFSFGTIVDVLEDGIADETYPADINKKWVKFTDGTYGASNYPDSNSPEVRMELVEEAPPSSSKPAYITAHFSDGSSERYVPE